MSIVLNISQFDLWEIWIASCYNSVMNTNNLPEIVLGVVTNSDGKVLIAQRTKKEKGAGNVILSWVFPGGGIKNSETKEETVQREVLEETGYKVQTKSIITEKQHPDFPVYVYYMHCVLENDTQIQEPSDSEISEIKWVDPKDIKNYFIGNLDSSVAKFFKI